GAGPSEPPSGPPGPAATGTTGGGVRIAGYVVAALGVGGAATFAIAGSMANGRFSDIQKQCGTARCTDPSLHGTIAGGRTLDVVADVGLGVGIAGIAAAVPMILFGGPKAATAAAGLTLRASPSGAALGYTARF
ncbi:MAG TPA: hypothetical protein VHB21_03290, partial [Minicystis sp.]|nr:hypothetical protein [Minicystis sp.]